MSRAKRHSVCLVFLFLGACAGDPNVRDLGFWGLGWQFTAVQNRLQPAIPPVLAYLRERYPGIKAAKVPSGFEQEFRGAILSAPGKLQHRLDRRLVRAFTVTGLPCAATAYAVEERDWAVGAFLVLDVGRLSRSPGDWTPCPPFPPGDAGDRVPALRALIATLVDVTAPKHLSGAR